MNRRDALKAVTATVVLAATTVNAKRKSLTLIAMR